MLDAYWLMEAHRFDVEEHERKNRLRARWHQPQPVTRSVGYRQRLAGLLLLAANWLDPRRAEPSRPAWVGAPVSRNGTVALVGYRRT